MIKFEFFINTAWRSKLSVDFLKSPWRNVMPTSCMACMVTCMCPCIFVIGWHGCLHVPMHIRHICCWVLLLIWTCVCSYHNKSWQSTGSLHVGSRGNAHSVFTPGSGHLLTGKLKSKSTKLWYAAHLSARTLILYSLMDPPVLNQQHTGKAPQAALATGLSLM